jgi:hypothetical protein
MLFHVAFSRARSLRAFPVVFWGKNPLGKNLMAVHELPRIIIAEKGTAKLSALDMPATVFARADEASG